MISIIQLYNRKTLKIVRPNVLLLFLLTTFCFFLQRFAACLAQTHFCFLLQRATSSPTFTMAHTDGKERRLAMVILSTSIISYILVSLAEQIFILLDDGNIALARSQHCTRSSCNCLVIFECGYFEWRKARACLRISGKTKIKQNR